MEMGFIGLGGMGEPIARNLIKAGHALKVYNRTRSRAEALLSQGPLWQKHRPRRALPEWLQPCWLMTPPWKAWCSENRAF